MIAVAVVCLSFIEGFTNLVLASQRGNAPSHSGTSLSFSLIDVKLIRGRANLLASSFLSLI